MSVLTDTGIPAEVLGQDLVDVRPLNQEGGFSSLFRAHKQGLDVDVVIKRVKSQFKGKMDEGSEARILTGLRHQYLPRIYDFKRASDGYCYTIMELVPGCTLREYVQAHGALDQKQTLAWTLQLCQVTEYMHGRSPAIIHSDLKPENVMITPDGDICVIDFNASLVAKEEEMEAIGASSGYAAPEQYNFAPELFPAIVHSIAGQQISTKAHETVWGRLVAGLGTVSPETVLAQPEETLRGFGLSGRKVGFIRRIAAVFAAGELDPAALSALPDEAVVARLTQLPGIGTWSAEMLLLFCLQRPDVVSYGDLGIRRGMCRVYGKREIDRAFFARKRRRYSPCGSVASLYLWAVSAEPQPRVPSRKRENPGTSGSTGVEMR